MLPNLELKTSNGFCLTWPSFWNCFDSSIHKNTDVNDIDKFLYLQ